MRWAGIALIVVALAVLAVGFYWAIFRLLFGPEVALMASVAVSICTLVVVAYTLHFFATGRDTHAPDHPDANASASER